MYPAEDMNDKKQFVFIPTLSSHVKYSITAERNLPSSNPKLEESKNFRYEEQDSLRASVKASGNILRSPILNFTYLEDSPQKLLAWSSYQNNNIRIVQLETGENYADFEGVKLKKTNHRTF